MKEKTKVALFVPSNDGSFRNPEPIRMMLTILEVGTPESIEKERKEMEAQMQAMQKEAQERLANEPANIQKYIADNKLTGYKSTPDGIWYKISAPGSAAHPKVENKVKVHYKGTLLDGSEFDSSYSRGEPAEFPLGGVIQGWQKAIPLLGKGGKGTFIIPSGLAYGEQSPSPAIPPNSTLVFEVELLDIN
jgi:FKBP-type peptidyl-prolyl cis-trans isomerase